MGVPRLPFDNDNPITYRNVDASGSSSTCMHWGCTKRVGGVLFHGTA